MSEISDSDRVRSLRLHDSNLFSIESRDHVVKLKFQRNDDVVTIVMHDVKGMWVGNFLSGNIVFDVALYSADDFPYGPDDGGAGVDVVSKYVEYYGKISSIPDNQLRVLLINPSYGAEALICFRGDIYCYT